MVAPLLRDVSRSTLPPQHLLQGGGIPASGDLDGDGDVDLLMALPGGGVEVWINDGLGRFSDETGLRILHPGHVVSALAIGDIDGDGDADVIVGSGASAAGFADRIWINNGAGRFGSWIDLPLLGVNTSGIVLGDFNSDGWVDIVFAVGEGGHSTQGAPDRLFLGDPLGHFTLDQSFAAAQWNESVTASTSVEAGDVDADGDLDLFFTKYDALAVGGSPGGQNVLLLNDGNGSFADVSESHLLPLRRKDNSSDCTLSDLDGDGDLDLVVSNSLLSVSGALSADVLWNQGGAQGGTPGYFVDGAGDLPENPIPAESIRLSQVVADFDGDGLGDILFLVHDLPPGGQQPLYLGRLGGGFVRAPWFHTSTFVGHAGVAFDADGDGDKELLITAAGSVAGGFDPYRTRFYRNLTQ